VPRPSVFREIVVIVPRTAIGDFVNHDWSGNAIVCCKRV
jgi:hypothetical protein